MLVATHRQHLSSNLGQMARPHAGLQAQILAISSITNSIDPLQRYMLPHLDLRSAMLLASTCRAWRHLISLTSPSQMSESSCRALLPSGLTSTLPLLELVQQQAKLLAKLRAKQGFSPGMQRLTVKHNAQDSDQQRDGYQRAIENSPGFTELAWAPCASLEDPSCYIALNSDWGAIHKSIVINTETGRPVCLEGQSSASIMAGHAAKQGSNFYATWLDGHRLLFFPASVEFDGSVSASDICLADVGTGNCCTLALSSAQQVGRSSLFAIRSNGGSSKDLFCWISNHEGGEKVVACDLQGAQPLYQLTCPDHLMNSFLRSSGTSSGCDMPTAGEQRGSSLETLGILVSPTKDALAVLWTVIMHSWKPCYRGTGPGSPLMGLSIHSAITGQCQHSVSLTAEYSFHDGDVLPVWLPGSSNLVFVNRMNLLICMASSGRKMWSTHLFERGLALLGAHETIYTDLFIAPCGRFILVLDLRTGGLPSVHWVKAVSIVDASSGKVLHNLVKFHNTPSQSTWSKSGEVCLLEKMNIVLAAGPCARKFRELRLEARCQTCHSYRCHEMNTLLSLSPCGRIVIGISVWKPHLAVTHLPALLTWRLPSASALADGEVSAKTVLPAACAGMTGAMLRDQPPAWHPMHSACMYAVADVNRRVYLVDAIANQCVKWWCMGELYGPASSYQPAQVFTGLHDGADDDMVNLKKITCVSMVMSWSGDGTKLAASFGQSCNVLCF